VYRKTIVEDDEWKQAKVRTGYSLTRTYLVSCKDSTVKDVIVRAVILSGGTVCTICEDLTERNKAEQTHRLLSSIIASTSDAVFAKNNQGTIISWNKAAEHLYGYSEEEMIGQNISRIIPADRTEEMEKIFSHINQGESVSNLETRRIRKDGRCVDVSVTVSPIMDDAGTVTGASTIARDITSHKAEERLRDNEQQYRSLVENIPVGFYRSTGDPTGRFIWGNSSLVHMLGYSSFEDLSGVGIADIFVEQDGRKRLLEDLKKEGFVKNREIALRRADGNTVSVLVTALARFDPSGALSCINGIVEDITSQKQAEQQVQIVNKQMQDILTCIPDPVVIVDSKHAVLAWNAAMEKLTGVQETGVIGRIDFCHHFPFYNPACPALFTLLDADDDEIKKYYPDAFREGTTIIAQVKDRARQKVLSSCFTLRAAPLCDPQGTRIGALQIIQSATPDSRTSSPSPP
jgi:PAS domain S-box-containing protein